MARRLRHARSVTSAVYLIARRGATASRRSAADRDSTAWHLRPDDDVDAVRQLRRRPRSHDGAAAFALRDTGPKRFADERKCRHVELRHFDRQFEDLPFSQHKVTMRLPLRRECGSVRPQGQEPGAEGREIGPDYPSGRRGAARGVLRRLSQEHARPGDAGLWPDPLSGSLARVPGPGGAVRGPAEGRSRSRRRFAIGPARWSRCRGRRRFASSTTCVPITCCTGG